MTDDTPTGDAEWDPVVLHQTSGPLPEFKGNDVWAAVAGLEELAPAERYKLPAYRAARFTWVAPPNPQTEIFGKPDDTVAVVLGTLALPNGNMWMVAGFPGTTLGDGDKVRYLRCSEWELAEWIEP